MAQTDVEVQDMTHEELIAYGFSQSKLTQLENELLHRLESMVEIHESDDGNDA